MSGRWAVAGAVLGLVIGTIAFAPAAWLSAWIGSATGGQIQLADARGSAWRGSAQLVLSGGDGSRGATALPSRVDWDIGVGLHGLTLRLEASCCTATGLDFTLEPRWRGLVLLASDRNSQWPAGLLSGLGAPWNTVQAEGTLHFSSERLSVEWSGGGVSMTGTARLDALGMSSRLSTLRPIGSYRLTLAGDGQEKAPTMLLDTLEGSLKLVGTGQWNGSRWTFRGEASAAPERESALGNLLNMVGRRQGAKAVISMG